MKNEMCHYCSGEFEAKNTKQIYCSLRCKTYESRLRSGLRPNPYDNVKYTDVYELIEIYKKCNAKNLKFSAGNAICENVIRLLELGHYKKIRQVDIDYISKK